MSNPDFYSPELREMASKLPVTAVGISQERLREIMKDPILSKGIPSMMVWTVSRTPPYEIAIGLSQFCRHDNLERDPGFAGWITDGNISFKGRNEIKDIPTQAIVLALSKFLEINL